MDAADELRLKMTPGMHGAHCQRCAYLFDAFDTPTPINDAIMRMETTRCPRCKRRDKLFLLMPFRYREMVEHIYKPRAYVGHLPTTWTPTLNRGRGEWYRNSAAYL
jgi:hypothetical protein